MSTWHGIMLVMLVIAAGIVWPIRIKSDAEIADDIQEDLL